MSTELFHFAGADGKDYTLPKQIPSGALRKSRDAKNPMDQVFLILEAVATPETLDALDALNVPELTIVAQRWMQGATAPNLFSSPTSSTASTDARSSETSENDSTSHPATSG